MKIKRIYLLSLLLVFALCLYPFREHFRRPAILVYQIMRGRKTLAGRVAEYSDVVHHRLGPAFASVHEAYPPQKVTLVGIKAARILQVWVAGADGEWKHLKDYPVLGMSGGLGPKLADGDGQAPEGLYRVESLNPNSIIHLSLRLNYPNADDLRHAQLDGRTQLGTDIMIHGGTASGGCLAMGDPAAEDLFVLVAETGIPNVSIILTPVDFSKSALPAKTLPLPKWSDELYASIKVELAKLEPVTKP